MPAHKKNFIVLDSVHGPTIIHHDEAHNAESPVRTGQLHLQAELDALLQIMNELPDGCIAVDGGARLGQVCMPLARRLLAKHGHVHAFEPHRASAYALCGTVALNQLDNLTVHHLGLAAANASMMLPFGHGAAGPAVPTHAHVDTRETLSMEVPVVRLDALGLSRLDFLRLDIGGMEVDALQGARQLLKTHKPWCWIQCSKPAEQAVMAEFAGLDYDFYNMDGRNLLCVPVIRWNRERLHIYGDALKTKAPFETLPAGPRDVDSLWRTAMEHHDNCEWGHALDLWRQLRGRGLNEADIALNIAACAVFA
ncbi:MAG: FkbM family methyltransferase, partial [Alcaligenaceae bacterium]